MLSLHTNAASLTGQNTLTSTNKALSTSLTRLSTGYRVNSAMDDAAGLQIDMRHCPSGLAEQLQLALRRYGCARVSAPVHRHR